MEKKHPISSRHPNPDHNPTREKGDAELPAKDPGPGADEVILKGGKGEGGAGRPGADIPPGAQEPRATRVSFNGPGIRHTALNRADPHPRKSGAV